MKTITANALTEINKQYGTEPLILVEIEWLSGTTRLYSSREITGAKNKILEIGSIDSTITDDNKQSQSVTLTLDDTDGEIKSIITSIDIHKIKCRVYQHYKNLSLVDKILLLNGQISAPFTWGEDDRTVSFEILSEIENYEVGFSPEEGQLPFVSRDFIGQPWPLCFGSVVHVPAQKVHQTLTGLLLEDIGQIDQTLYWKLNRLIYQRNEQITLSRYFKGAIQSLDAVAPPVEQILNNYVQIILNERQQTTQLTNLLKELDEAKTEEQKHPNINKHKKTREETEAKVDLQAKELNFAHNIKTQLETHTDDALYEFELKKKVTSQYIDAYNAARFLEADIIQVQQEICRQSKLVKTEFLIQDGELFPQDIEDTEININNVRFRGLFTGNKFTVAVGPYGKYQDLELDPWTPDTDPCQPEDENNGVSVFYLKDDPPPNLVGLYLLVKKKGGEEGVRHIIKVLRQDGKKVIFELVEWDQHSGQPGGMSLDSILDKLKSVPETGQLDSSLLFRPETAKLSAIINNIPGGVNEREYEYLGKLVFLEPLDSLASGNVFSRFQSQTSSTIIFDNPTPRTIFTIIGQDIEIIQDASGAVLEEWLNNFTIPFEEIPDTTEWKAEAGSIVRANTDDCQIYICNILPSEIHAVNAYRTLINGKRILAQVPSSYYTKLENQNLGTINVTALIFKRALREIEGENWEDDIYVTLTSTEGPNPADIIQYLIETYTDGTIDTTSFTDVKNKLIKFPMHFALFDRPNVLDEIARIAWETRCAVYRIGTKFYLKYLSFEPTEDVTFTLADIETESLKVTHTRSEELVTRLRSTYKQHYLPLEDGKKDPELVYRYRIKQYQLHHRDEFFHCYNITSLVQRSASFWLLRLGNTWKKVTFRTVLKHLRLDIYDTILFNINNEQNDYFCNTTVKGVIESINYDIKDKTIEITCWLPIRAGEMEQYPLAWPAGQSQTFPTEIDIQKGYLEPSGPGSGVTGTIPGC